MAVVRTIDVQKQKRLSLSKCFRLVMSGIKHRLLRSGLTMSVILLAVAFFMAMLSESMFIRATAIGIHGEIQDQREAATFLSLITAKPGSIEMAGMLAEARSRKGRIDEFAAVSGWDRQEIADLAKMAAQEQVYLNFFDNMRLSQRHILVKKNEGREIFRFLNEEEHWQAFETNLEPLRSLTVPGEVESLKSFVNSYEGYLSRLSKFVDVWRLAISKLEQATNNIIGSTSLARWLVDPNQEALAKWAALVRNTGFSLTDEDLLRYRRLLEKRRLRNDVVARLALPEMRTAWKGHFNRRMKLDEKLETLDRPDVAKLLNEGFDRKFTVDELREVSALYRKERSLSSMERNLAGRTDAASGSVLSGRQVFLLFISFMVCMVGIANAMLMAITERFREIATMKCLGATDGYIMTQFMMEAGLQGLMGGVLGMLIGFVLALLKSSVLFGGYLYSYAADWVLMVLISGVFSVMLGVMLASLASIYPSWAASRMAPMEAMRVE